MWRSVFSRGTRFGMSEYYGLEGWGVSGLCVCVCVCVGVCVCVLLSGCSVCRSFDLCVCRVGTPP